jgi:hypothetical protein
VFPEYDRMHAMRCQTLVVLSLHRDEVIVMILAVQDSSGIVGMQYAACLIVF